MIHSRQIFPVRRVLDLPLVVHIRQEIAMLQVRVQLFGVAEVLRRDEPLLDEARPPAPAEERLPAAAEVVGRAAGLELGDAVVLAAEGDEGVDGRGVAALDVGAQELPALREPQRVDPRRRAEDVVRVQLRADAVHLRVHVAEEAGLSVAAAAGGEVDEVHVGAWVGGFRERGDFAHPVALEVIA